MGRQLTEAVEASSLSSLFQQCSTNFRQLLVALRAANCLLVENGIIQADEVAEEYGRLLLWGEQRKATRPAEARGSLDDTLRHSKDIHNMVRQGLASLEVHLLRLSISASRKVDTTSDSASLTSVTESSADDSEDQSEYDDEDKTPRYVSQRRVPRATLIFRSIKDEMGLLFEISALIRRPVVQNKWLRSKGSGRHSTTEAQQLRTAYALVDLRHIEEKVVYWRETRKDRQPVAFEDEKVAAINDESLDSQVADVSWLSKRLAQANQRRREQLEFWADHPYGSASSGPIDQPADAPALTPAKRPTKEPKDSTRSEGTTIKEAQTTTVVTARTKHSFSTVAASEVQDFEGEIRPRTVYAPSMGGQRKSNRVPDAPKPVEDAKTATCPICGMELRAEEVKDRQSWKRHVFRDLRPYVCTFEDCWDPEKLFVTRNDWIYHELLAHRRHYSCRLCDAQFARKEDISTHLQEVHHHQVSSTQRGSFLDLCHEQMDDTSLDVCLLCGTEMSLLNMQVHLATHLEDLALFVLRNTIEDDEAGSKAPLPFEGTQARRVASSDLDASDVESLSFDSDPERPDQGGHSNAGSDDESTDGPPGAPLTTHLGFEARDPAVSSPAHRESTAPSLPSDGGLGIVTSANHPSSQIREGSTLSDTNSRDDWLLEGRRRLLDATMKGDADLVDRLLQPPSDLPDFKITPLIFEAEEPRLGSTPLHEAAKQGREDIVGNLLSRGAFVDPQDDTGARPLQYAVEFGHLEVAEQLMRQGATFKSLPGGFAGQMLYLAAEGGNTSKVQWILQHFGPYLELSHDALLQGVIISARVRTLMIAAEHGHADVVSLLLSKGLYVGVVNEQRQTAAHLAAAGGHLECLEVLVTNGIDLTFLDTSRQNALFKAVTAGHIPAVEFLLKNGADPNQRTQSGLTALHSAALANHSKIVDLLLDSGADIEAKTTNGRTPLFSAVEGSSLEAAKRLVHRQSTPVGHSGRASVNAFDDKESVLHYAIRKHKLEIVMMLVLYGADLNKADKDSKTPLFCAIQGNALDLVRFLLSRGVNIEDSVLKSGHGARPLHRAAELGHTEIAQYLLKQGAEPESRDLDGWGSLHHAAGSPHANIVRILLNLGISPHPRTYTGRTPLHIATMSGNIAAANLLLEFDADIDAADKDGRTSLFDAVAASHENLVKIFLHAGASVIASAELRELSFTGTPLHIAAIQGSAGIVELLVEKGGAEVNLLSITRETPLQLASSEGHRMICEYLVNKGAWIGAGSTEQGTPLQRAAEQGHLEVCRYLVDAGANVNAARVGSHTPLHMAANNGHLALCRVLVEAGAYINAVSTSNYTPLHMAAQNGHLAMCQYLLHGGANVKTRSAGDYTPLHMAARNGHLAVCRVLVDAGADFNAVAAEAYTPLHMAAVNGHLAVCQYLVDAGANVNAVKARTYTPLYMAAENGHLAVCRFLVDAGTNVNAVMGRIYTPLHIAAERGHPAVCRFLVDAGANVHAVTVRGYTPLHIAAGRGYLEVCRYLVDAGSNVNAVAVGTSTPLHKAAEFGHMAVCRFLVQAGADILAQTGSGQTPASKAAEGGLSAVYKYLIDPEADLTGTLPVEEANHVPSGAQPEKSDAAVDAVTGDGPRITDHLDNLATANRESMAEEDELSQSSAAEASLGPKASLRPEDWSQPQVQGHRRYPSEFSGDQTIQTVPNRSGPSMAEQASQPISSSVSMRQAQLRTLAMQREPVRLSQTTAEDAEPVAPGIPQEIADTMGAGAKNESTWQSINDSFARVDGMSDFIKGLQPKTINQDRHTDLREKQRAGEPPPASQSTGAEAIPAGSEMPPESAISDETGPKNKRGRQSVIDHASSSFLSSPAGESSQQVPRPLPEDTQRIPQRLNWQLRGRTDDKRLKVWKCCNCYDGWFSIANNWACPSCSAYMCNDCEYAED